VIYSKGDIELRILSCLSANLDNEATVESLEISSLSESNIVYWLSRKSQKIETLLTSLIGVEKAMGPIANDLTQSDERKKRAQRYLNDIDAQTKPQIIEEIKRCLREGHIIFRGNSRSISDSSDNLNVIFNREISRIIPQIYTQFHRAKYKIDNEKKTIEAIFERPSKSLKAIEPGLGLFDDQGNIKRTTPAVADIVDYLDKASRQGQRVSGDDLSKKFSGIPYGWDPNLARVVAASLFRISAISIRYENSLYQDYKIEEAQRIFIDIRKFNRSEINLEIEEPLSQKDLQKAREEIELLLNRKPYETATSISDALKDEIENLLSTHSRVNAWISGANFPIDDEFIKAPDVLKNITSPDRPNPVVKRFLENLQSFRSIVGSIKRAESFYESADRQKVPELEALLRLARFLGEHVERKEMPHTVEAADFLEKAWKDKTLIDRFPEAKTVFLQASPEIKGKFEELKKKNLDHLRSARDRLLNLIKQEGFEEKQFLDFFEPLEKKTKMLKESQFDLASGSPAFQGLWFGTHEIDDLEDKIRFNIAAKISEIKRKPKKERKRLRFRDIPNIPRVISDEKELDTALSGIGEAIKSELDEDREVELD